MLTASLTLALTMATLGSPIPDEVVQLQNDSFQNYLGTDFVWKFDDLPEKGSVPDERKPYSGYIYLDRAGGTTNALYKYDRAFNRGRSSAASWEQWDTTAFKERPRGGTGRRGLFGALFAGVPRTPAWHGHCNGWAAAALRHAEPKNSVTFNGVVFTPADIKGLLAEIYIYNDSIVLSGNDYRMNAGEFHAIVTNWVGLHEHGIGMEADPGEEKWNYPLYSYAASSARRGNNAVEVKMNVAYAKDSNREYQESPRDHRVKYFHYLLELDNDGNIVGGSFYRDSSIIDMLWTALRPKPGGQPGNERGNPHVDVDQVLAVWRASVSEEERRNWVVFDAAELDRFEVETEEPEVLAEAETEQPADEETADAGEEAAPAESEESDMTEAPAEVAETEEAAEEAPQAEVADARSADAPSNTSAAIETTTEE